MAVKYARVSGCVGAYWRKKREILSFSNTFVYFTADKEEHHVTVTFEQATGENRKGFDRAWTWRIRTYNKASEEIFGTQQLAAQSAMQYIKQRLDSKCSSTQRR